MVRTSVYILSMPIYVDVIWMINTMLVVWYVSALLLPITQMVEFGQFIAAIALRHDFYPEVHVLVEKT